MSYIWAIMGLILTISFGVSNAPISVVVGIDIILGALIISETVKDLKDRK